MSFRGQASWAKMMALRGRGWSGFSLKQLFIEAAFHRSGFSSNLHASGSFIE
jgi:hypothetical protein